MEANTTNASEINEINEITTEKPNFSTTDLENMNYSFYINRSSSYSIKKFLMIFYCIKI